jgi:hypothetical protein
MKKQLILSLILLSILLGCNKTKSKTELPSEPAVEQQEEMEPVVVEEEEPAIVIPDVPLGFLVTYQGKYAAQEKLFENETIADRLKALNRFNYDALLQNYNTETPIIIVDNIAHMSGCKQHDCPSNAYDFFIDLDNDNINVYHFRSNMLRVYQEKGMIDLPAEFATEMETKKNNAGIGDPDRIESRYSLE